MVQWIREPHLIPHKMFLKFAAEILQRLLWIKVYYNDLLPKSYLLDILPSFLEAMKKLQNTYDHPQARLDDLNNFLRILKVSGKIEPISIVEDLMKM
jgi:hypothetical protein